MAPSKKEGAFLCESLIKEGKCREKPGIAGRKC